MVQNKCVVTDCLSGHEKKDENGEIIEDKERVHFFYIPEAGLKLWAKAIARKDIRIRPGLPVCEKHFADEDVIIKKEILGPNGENLGISTTFKFPKLRNGAIPTVNLGYDPKDQPEDSTDSASEDLNLRLEEEKSLTDNESIYDQFEEVDSEVETTEQPKEKDPLEIRENLVDETKLEIKKEPDDETLFDMIFTSERCVVLPPYWTRQNMKVMGERMVVFNQFLPRYENGTMEPVCGKQVILDKNLNTDILIMRHKIKKEESELKNLTVSTIEDLECMLKIVNIWKICCGFKFESDEFDVPFLHIDKEGFSRSVNCIYNLPAVAKGLCCVNCKKCKKVIARKQYRLNKKPNLTRLRCNLNGQQRRKLDEMRREIRKLKRGKDRAVARIEQLKELRIKDRENFEASKKTLSQLVCESKLELNQKLVMFEMLSAAKTDSSRGRRYSRRWIEFSYTLYKESPSMYRYLRNNHVLPLPATATIFKFAQQQNLALTPDPPLVYDEADTEEIIEFIFENEIIPTEELPEIEMETEIV